MDEKRKVRGNFRIYLQWPIFLIGPDGPADSCCGGSFIKSRHYSFIFYSYLYWNSVMAVFFQEKRHIGGTYRVFPGL